jgi:hypothetical protein
MRQGNMAVESALRTARKAVGGSLGPSSAETEKLHTGPIHSPVAGRTDHLPMHVPSGSYVIPADIISAMGEGNTMAGFKLANKLFENPSAWMSGAPYGDSPSPYGGSGSPYGDGETPYSGPSSPYGAGMPGKAGGGAASGVPIVAAGGEYVIHPDAVAHIGGGDMEAGHRHLDDFVKKYRAKTVNLLKKLPGPKRD